MADSVMNGEKETRTRFGAESGCSNIQIFKRVFTAVLSLLGFKLKDAAKMRAETPLGMIRYKDQRAHPKSKPNCWRIKVQIQSNKHAQTINKLTPFQIDLLTYLPRYSKCQVLVLVVVGRRKLS